jgi:SAM-dependent methyltransferase
MDALGVRELGERFDVALCFGILHRVTDPTALLRALADALAPGGEIVLETYGSRLAAGAPPFEAHEPGDVYARDDFVHWGFSPEGLRRLGRIVGLDVVEVVDQLEIDGHPRILAVLRAAQAASDVAAAGLKA